MQKRKGEVKRMPVKEEKIYKRDYFVSQIRHRFQLNSIRMKLMASFSIPILLIILLGIITYQKASDVIINNYKSSAYQTITANGDYLKLICDNVEAKSTQIVSNANLTKYYAGGFTKNSSEEYNIYNSAYQDLLATVGSDKFIYSIHILSPKYNPISTYANFSSEEYKKYSDSDDAAIFDQSGKKIWWTGYHKFLDDTLGTSTNKYALSLTRYLYNKSLKPIGYVILDVKAESIHQVLNRIDFGENSSTAIFTGDGRMLEKENIQQELTILNTTFYLDSLQNKKESGFQDVNFQNGKYLYLYYKVGDTGTILFSLIPENVILAQVNQIKMITIGIVLLAIFIALFISTAISMGMSSTINKIVSGVKKAADGDLTVHMETKRRDELGVLVENISDMIYKMKQLIEKTVEVTGTVKDSAGSVGQTAGAFILASKKIAEALYHIEQGSGQQASDAQNCLLMMDSLSAKIGEVYQNTDDIEGIAGSTKDIVNNGLETVSNLEERVADTSNMARIITDEITDLKNAAESIRDIVLTMDYIADQTSLLSLNASIEAARAGKAGSGFAVVAEEIRKLANQSMDASDQVKEKIKRIDDRTNHMVDIAEKTSNVVLFQESALIDTVSIFSKIDRQVDNLVIYLRKISEGIKTVETVKVNTLGSIESISSIIEEAAAVTGDVNSTAQGQLTMAEKLKEATVQLEHNADSLEEAVRIFKIKPQSHRMPPAI